MNMLLLLTLATTLTHPAHGQHNYRPKEGYVSRAETAIKIAEAVLEPIYGKDTIARERPFAAQLKGGTWTIHGTMPAGFKGGVAIVRISKTDGRILGITHGK